MLFSLAALGYWQVKNGHLRGLLEELKQVTEQVCSFNGTKVRGSRVF